MFNCGDEAHLVLVIEVGVWIKETTDGLGVDDPVLDRCVNRRMALLTVRVLVAKLGGRSVAVVDNEGGCDAVLKTWVVLNLERIHFRAVPGVLGACAPLRHRCSELATQCRVSRV